jgi:hypothetical protein
VRDEVTPPSAPDLTALLRSLANEMRIRGRLADPAALYAGGVRREIWARTEELTDPTSRTLTAHLDGGELLTVPIRHTAAGEAVGGMREHEGISVFMAGDHDALAQAIGRYLVHCGFLHDAADLRPETVRETPAERLDPDSIWTNAPTDFAVSTLNNPEVHST